MFVGVNQCPINTIDKTTKSYLSPINTVTSLVYTFQPEKEGTFWYHGHYAVSFTTRSILKL